MQDPRPHPNLKSQNLSFDSVHADLHNTHKPIPTHTRARDLVSLNSYCLSPICGPVVVICKHRAIVCAMTILLTKYILGNPEDFIPA